uniref:Uncharacterized protein n=1 Tax=Rhizophora mucronata TaxID=61149 RepID=A0A2P2IK76_RHIMU
MDFDFEKVINEPNERKYQQKYLRKGRRTNESKPQQNGIERERSRVENTGIELTWQREGLFYLLM